MPSWFNVRFRILLIFTLTFALVVSVLAYGLYTSVSADALALIQGDLRDTLEGAIMGLDGDELQALYTSGTCPEATLEGCYPSDPRYWRQVAWLVTVHQIEPRAEPFTFVRGSAPGEFIFLTSAGAARTPPFGAKFLEHFVAHNPDLNYRGLITTTLDSQPYTDKFGHWISGYAPIYNSQGEVVAALGVDFDAQLVETAQRRIRSIIVVYAAILYAVLFLVGFVTLTALSNSLTRLINTARRFREGDLNARAALSGLMSGDELGQLATTLADMAQSLAQREQERQKAMGQWRESNSTARALFDAMTDTVVLIDHTGKILDYNPVVARNLQTRIAAGTFENAYELPVSALSLNRRAHMEEVFRTGQPAHFQDEAAGHWFDNVIYPIRADDGAVTKIAVVARDITEQRKLEAALRQEAQRSAALARMAQRLNAQLTEAVVLQTVCDEAREALQVSAVSVSLFDPATDLFRFAAVAGLPVSYGERSTPLPITLASLFKIEPPLTVIPDVQKLPGMPDQPLYEELDVRTVMSAGMFRDGQLIGHLNFVTLGEIREFTLDEQTLASAITYHATQALSNARLLADAKQHAHEFVTLYQITANLMAHSDLSDLLETIVEQALKLLAVPSGTLYLYDATQTLLTLTVTRGLTRLPEDYHLRVGQGAVGHVAQTREPLRLDDYSHWEHRLPGYDASQLSSTVVVPMLYNAELVGVLSVEWVGDTPHHFTKSDERLLTLMATQAASAVHNARLYAAEQRAREVTEILKAANLALTQTLDLDLILNSLLDYLARLVPFDSANVMLRDVADPAYVTERAIRGYEQWVHSAPLELLRFHVPSVGGLRRLFEIRVSVLIDDTRATPYWSALENTNHVFSWLGVPLLIRGEVMGLYSLDKTTPNFFTVEHQRLAEALSAPAAIAIENARLFAELTTNQARLRQLTQQVLQVQDQERQRLSRELHDEAGQALVALQLNLQSLLTEIAPGRVLLTQRLEQAVALVETTMEQVRTLAHNLHPPALTMVGLHEALDDYCFDFGEHSQLIVAYTGEHIPDLSNEASITLYRFVQEALANVGKHAGHAAVIVNLSLSAHEVLVRVSDNGSGFDLQQTPWGLGLTGMRERMELLNGRLEVDSAPGRGTTLVAHLPHPAGGHAPAGDAAPRL